jgi:transposase InsO family protein
VGPPGRGRYTQRLADLGIAASVGSVAEANDNAMAELRQHAKDRAHPGPGLRDAFRRACPSPTPSLRDAFRRAGPSPTVSRILARDRLELGQAAPSESAHSASVREEACSASPPTDRRPHPRRVERASDDPASDAEIAVVEYLGWFNHTRLHGSLGDVPPAEFELDAPQNETITSTLISKATN